MVCEYGRGQALVDHSIRSQGIISTSNHVAYVHRHNQAAAPHEYDEHHHDVIVALERGMTSKWARIRVVRQEEYNSDQLFTHLSNSRFKRLRQ